jgi:hypothetical protein
MKRPYRTIVEVVLGFNHYSVSGKYTPANGEGEPEHFEITGVRGETGEQLLGHLGDGTIESLAAECLKECRDD